MKLCQITSGGARIVLALVFASPAVSQTHLLRVQVRDIGGTPRQAECSLTRNHIETKAPAGTDGICVFSSRQPGRYLLYVMAAGFAPTSTAVQITGAPLTSLAVTLRLPQTRISVDVNDSTNAANPEPGNAADVTEESLSRRHSSQMSRDAVDLVRSMPGWLTEANGVLHPRGSEYNTQFIVDGVPEYENISPAFAPAVPIADVQSMSSQTGGYPASIGRKLGGVVELHTRTQLPLGWHGTVAADGGGFGSRRGVADIGWSRQSTSVFAGASFGQSDRFLDPPTIANFTNTGRTFSSQGTLSHHWSERKSMRINLQVGQSDFQVPNELQQQILGQSEKRHLQQQRLAFAFDQLITDSLLFQFRSSADRGTAELDSNSDSIPIVPFQARSNRWFYSSGSISGHLSHHDYSAGSDVLVTALHESFQYRITDPAVFDSGVAGTFKFDDRKAGVETAAYVQDRISFGPFIANLGLRWDGYNFLVNDDAWSPRAAGSWSFGRLGLVLHASYDRVFDTPAVENLLLASSPAVKAVNPAGLGLPVHPERGSFYEVGISKTVLGSSALGVRFFRRSLTNFADDDVFLNTGISFPISFAQAHIEGVETTLRVPVTHRVSAGLAYSNLSGTASLPVTGGLFLSGAQDLLHSTDVFRITQDQRTTLSSELWYELNRRAWVGSTFWYGSGLPAEIDSGEVSTTDRRILNQVDFARGRIKPSYSIDFAGGIRLWSESARAIEADASITNVTDHLNVINFASLFSGTAISAPRSFDVRLKYTF